jgi:transposase
VSCYVGLRPKRGGSGERQPQLRSSKEGDIYLRKRVRAGRASHPRSRAGYGLEAVGERIWRRGVVKNAKKRAVVEVARKLAILLHGLWVTGEVYEPLRNSPAR